ncbi:MAG: WD40/YVTN/BNR-like repeat-containing protein, partial [Gaiellaceae bacterium]
MTWTQLPFTASSNFYWVNRIAHHPTTSGLLLAATSTGVWRTTDGGANWTQTLAANAEDVDFYPGSPNLAIVGGNPGVWTSADGGMNWTPQATGAVNKLPGDGGRCEVAVAPSAFQTYYVSMDRNQGEIWRSTDGGATWTLQNTGNKYLSVQGWYANALWVDPTNSNVIVVGGLDMRRSSNGGVSLDNISNWQCFPDCAGIIHSAHADQHVLVSPPGYNGTTNRLVFVGDDGGIQYTSDIYAAGNGGFGDGWAYSYNNLGITQFSGGAASPDGSLFVGGAQDNGQPRLQSLAGPNNWNSLYSFGDGGYAAVDPATPSRVYGEYVFLEMKRSDDSGGGYGDKYNGLGDAKDPSRALFIAPFTMDPSNPAT